MVEEAFRKPGEFIVAIKRVLNELPAASIYSSNRPGDAYYPLKHRNFSGSEVQALSYIQKRVQRTAALRKKTLIDSAVREIERYQPKKGTPEWSAWKRDKEQAAIEREWRRDLSRFRKANQDKEYRYQIKRRGIVSMAFSVYLKRSRTFTSTTLTVARLTSDRLAIWNGAIHLAKHGWGIIFQDGKFLRLGSYETMGKKGKAYF